MEHGRWQGGSRTSLPVDRCLVISKLLRTCIAAFTSFLHDRRGGAGGLEATRRDKEANGFGGRPEKIGDSVLQPEEEGVVPHPPLRGDLSGREGNGGFAMGAPTKWSGGSAVFW